MYEGLSIDYALDGDLHVMSVSGEVDLATGRQLASALSTPIGAAVGNLVLDLTDVTFLDSTGLAAVLHGLRRMTRQGRRMVLVCPPGPVATLLVQTRVRDLLEVCETRPEAERLLERSRTSPPPR